MHRTLLKHELLLMVNSKKNILFLLFLFIAAAGYCFIILPNTETVHSLSEQEQVELTEELSGLAALQRNREETGATGTTSMGGPAYATDADYHYRYSSILSAYENGNFERFLALRTSELERNPEIILEDPGLFPRSEMPHQDRRHLYRQTMLIYEQYLDHEAAITYADIEERTASQTLKNMLLSPIVYVMLFCVIYFSSDMLARDYRNRSVVRALPVSWYGSINIKSFVAFSYSLFVLIFFMALIFLFMAVQNGVGLTDIGVPVIPDPVGHITIEDYKLMPYSRFMLLSLSFLPVLVYLFSRLNMVFSLLFKNEWFVMAAGSAVLFSSHFYTDRPMEELFGIDVSYFPQFYFEFGKIVSGDRNVLLYTNTLTYLKGFVVLGVTLIVVECLLFLLTRIINKRRFYSQ